MGSLWYDIACSTAVTEATYRLEFKLTKDTFISRPLGQAIWVFVVKMLEKNNPYNGR